MSGSSVFLKLIYLLLPCLKYCICPTFFISITLHFPLMYIDTRTYWNVFLKHLHDSVLWFIFIYPFAFFALFASGKGYLFVCWYWFIISIFICLGFLVKNFGSRAQTKVCGLELKTCSAKWNQGFVALLVTQTTVVYILDWSQSVNLKQSDSCPFPPSRQIK